MILALVFIVSISLIAGALTDWAMNDLNNTTKFHSASALDYAATSTVEVAIQSMRYIPLEATTNYPQLSYCWPLGSGTVADTAGVSELQYAQDNNDIVAVWCDTIQTLGSSNTRLVTFYACEEPTSNPVQVTSTECFANHLLIAQVSYDDYPPGNSAPLTNTCSTSLTPSSYCGYGATTELWSWSNAVATIVGTKTNTITVTSTAPASATVGGTPYAPVVSATSGDVVQITTGTPNICTIANDKASFVGAGTCTIDFNDPGNSNFAPAAQVTQSFSVAAGAGTATKLAITSTAIDSSDTTSATNAFTITLETASNVATSTSTALTIGLTASPSGGAIFATSSGGGSVTSVTLPGNTSAVTAYFGDSVIGSPVITAAANALASGTQTETIGAGAGTKLAITSTAISSADSTSATNAFTVTLEDVGGNATTNASPITVNLAANPTTGAKFATTSGGGSVTSVTLPANTSAVTAYFGDSVTGGPVITASASGGLSSGTQTETITAGAANKLAWDVSPAGTVGETTAFTTQPKVYVEDVNNNVVTSDGGNVTLAIDTYTAGNGGKTQGTLTCTNAGDLTVAAAAGVATFSGCHITGLAAAGTYYLDATRTGIAGTAASSAITITAGTATQLVWDVQPAGTVGLSVAFTTQPIVYVEDANDNVVTSDTGNVTLAIDTHSAGLGTLACTGGNTVAASAGVATFTGCKITGVTADEGTYTFDATRNPLTSTPASGNVIIN